MSYHPTESYTELQRKKISYLLNLIFSLIPGRPNLVIPLNTLDEPLDSLVNAIPKSR